MTHKLYDVLGVSPSSSKDDIKKAYKKLAIQMHPDKGGDPEKFKEISHAYSVLSDDEKKNQYDQLGDEGFEQGGMQHHHVNPHDLFEQLFGGGGGFPFGFNVHMGGHGPQRKSNHIHELKISLEDAYRGMQKTMRVNISKLCVNCKEMCHACQGKGHVMDVRRMGFMTQMMQRPCDTCNTTGFTAKGKAGCSLCEGNGKVKEEHKIELHVPPGVESGHAMVFKGLGEQAVQPNEVSGDLVFQVHVMNHSLFQRQGRDLVFSQKMSLKESICGKDVRISHFDGDITFNTLDKFGIVQPNKPYTIRGKGMPGGDMLVLFDIQYPSKTLSAEEKLALQQAFSAISI